MAGDIKNENEPNANHIDEWKMKNISLSAIEALEDICIHVVDKNGMTVYYSKGCEIIENQSKEHVVGKHISDSYTSVNDLKMSRETSLALHVLETKTPVINKPMKYTTSGGKEIHVVSSAYPLFYENELVGSICVFKDNAQVIEMSSTIINLQNELYFNHRKPNENGTKFTFGNIIGISSAIKKSVDIAKRVAPTYSSVLIVGNTGTGKEVFAQSIHNSSLVASGPFIALNCSAIPESLLESTLFGTTKGAFTGAFERKGLFEEAQDGTLFLDEINSMDINLQAKLLRAIESKKIRRVGSNNEIPINARIISATNIDPATDIVKNNIRMDLYYRIAAITLEIPSLNQRKIDIPVLVNHFIVTKRRTLGKNALKITDEAMDLLIHHSWPGNVRELEHVIEYALSIIDYKQEKIDYHDLPEYLMTKKPNKTLRKYLERDVGDKNIQHFMKEIETEIITEALKKHKLNVNQTAKSLGVSRQHLQYRMKTLEIEKNNL